MTDGLGLGDAYGATLDRIKGQGGEKARLGMAALMWISHAERPLKSDELCHALAVEIGSADLNTDNVPSIGTLLSCCQGLVVVDKKASTARLTHITLQEYLRAHPGLFGTAHSMIAETCLSYPNSHQVKALSTISSPNLRGTPFLQYSSVYWGAHAKRDLSDCAKLLALKLFDDYNNHISTKILLGWHHYDPVFGEPDLFSGLHWACFFGVNEIVAGLVEMKSYDINQRDLAGNTPLVWAAKNGHEGVVKILLGRGDINPNKLGCSDRTPLWCAASNGHEGVVKMILGRNNVNPNKPDNHRQTPLQVAARNGHEEVVKILLGRDDVNPDEPDNHRQTPLQVAAWNGHEGVVKMLLGRGDINPNRPGRCDRTALWCASWNGHERVVKILLGRDDVSPDEPDNDGRSPLSCAACAGHERVVKILLGRGDVNPNKPDRDGQTPLFYAAQNGHARVVVLLQPLESATPGTT